jgi:PIN domain nuclease of toxin-antitoxin system
MAIKISLDKLVLTMPLKDFLREHIQGNNIGILDISVNHVLQTESLPYFHRDPFDRLIIAQAIVENLPVITADQHFNRYPITCLR